MLTQSQKQFHFTARNEHERYFKDKVSRVKILSGAAGTGKTRTNLELIHAICEKYPKARIAIVRLTRASLNSTVLVTFEDKVLPNGHPVNTKIDKTHRTKYDYPNGSEIWLFGLDKPQKLLSSEWDIIYLPEAVEIPYESYYILTTRLRNNIVPYQQIIGDTNPGGNDHWIKVQSDQKIISKYETTHFDNPAYFDHKTRNFDQSTMSGYFSSIAKSIQTEKNITDIYTDNNFLFYYRTIEKMLNNTDVKSLIDPGDKYYDYIQSLKENFPTDKLILEEITYNLLTPFNVEDTHGTVGRFSLHGLKYLYSLCQGEENEVNKYFRGMWGNAEGVIYNRYNPLTCMVPQVSQNDLWTPGYTVIPQAGDRWICCIDFGYTNPFSFLHLLLRDGTIYVVNQIYMTERIVELHAQDILDILGYRLDENKNWVPIRDYPYEIPEAFVCDHDAEDRATLEFHIGRQTTPAYKSVRDGINAVQEYLYKNKIKIREDSLYKVDKKLINGYNTYSLETEFPVYRWDQNKDQPVKKHDHALDNLRYGIAYFSELKDKIKHSNVPQTLNHHTLASTFHGNTRKFRNRHRTNRR